MNKSKAVSAKSKPFNWSKVSSGKIRSGLSAPPSEFHFDHRRKLSDSSDDTEWNIGTRQQQLLSNARHVAAGGVQKTKENLHKDNNNVVDRRQWLNSARQRELVRTNSGSNLLKSQDRCKSGLRQEWASTAKQRIRHVPLANNLSAGHLDSVVKEPSRDSAGNLGRSGSGADLLVEAVRYYRTRHIKLLLDGGTDPNSLDSEGVTALIASVADVDDPSRQNHLMHILLNAGADPNVCDCEGTSPLMHAASINCHDAAVILLQIEKTDCGIQDLSGFSALMYAASKGFANIVLLILAAFKKIHHVTYLSQRSRRGLSACDLAEENGYFDIVSLLKTDSELVPFSNPEGRSLFNTHTHELSRSPTPTDDDIYSSNECVASKFVDEKTFLPPTPVSELESLNSLDRVSPTHELTYFINNFADSSIIDSGNEADTESLMDGDVSLREVTAIMTTPNVQSGNSSTVDNDLPESPSQPVKLSINRNTIDIDKLQSVTNIPKAVASHVLNPLKNVVTIPFGLSEGMPRIDVTISNRYLNRSIKSLVQEEHESRPSNRPPTPARPSFPNLIHEISSSSSDTPATFGSSSTDVIAGGRTRRITIGRLARSSSEPKTISISPPQRLTQDEDDNSTDIFDVSTKSEGWDALWGPRGKGLSSTVEGHVVPLPPIGSSKSLSKRDRKSVGGTNMLNVAKKTLERLDDALSSSKNKQRKSRSLPRSRTIENLSS